VVRNKIKRRLREILRQTDLPPGWDIIMIARNPAAKADFTTLGSTVEDLLERAGMLLGGNESNRLGAD
jgi:ribonuclease P protein component